MSKETRQSKKLSIIQQLFLYYSNTKLERDNYKTMLITTLDSILKRFEILVISKNYSNYKIKLNNLTLRKITFIDSSQYRSSKKRNDLGIN